jgi:hypothetical protein
VLLVAALAAAWRAYREASAMAARELRELRARTDDIAATVQKTAEAVARGTHTVTSAIDDARRAMGTAGSWVASAAGSVASPRSAVVVGLLRGVQWWRRRRAGSHGSPDVDPPPALPPSGQRPVPRGRA